MKLLWEEFLCHGKFYDGGRELEFHLCGLCGNTGIVDTVGKVMSPAGVVCGVKTYCICPNGRAMKPKENKKRNRKGELLNYWVGWNEYSNRVGKKVKAIHGAWCTGQAVGGSDNYVTMTAWVVARNENEVKSAIRKGWPPRTGKGIDWRFLEERPKDWTPGNRFPSSV